jgi:branched-chain amino acid aminotransferase
MPEPLAYLNGHFLPQSQAVLPLHDAGFVMGATVTDLVRTFHLKLYRFADHLARFVQGCHDASIDPLPSASEITTVAEELIRHNAGLLTTEQELALVIFATPGPIGYYLGREGLAGSEPPTFGMHTFPLPLARFRRSVQEGARLVVPSIRQISAVPPHIKMRSRMHWWLADREVHRVDPQATALLLDAKGYITETASANMLIVREGKVLSPPSKRILQGISRGVVIELCGRLGIPFEEASLTIADLEAADEAMLSCTSYCLMGVSHCNGRAIPWPGPLFRRLLSAWNNEMGLDIHGQILT